VGEIRKTESGFARFFFEVSLHNIKKWVNYKKMTLIRP